MINITDQRETWLPSYCCVEDRLKASVKQSECVWDRATAAERLLSSIHDIQCHDAHVLTSSVLLGSEVIQRQQKLF